MDLGAHLPLVDDTGRGWRPESLTSYAHAASRLGYQALAANDHLTFSTPWLDGLVALSSVIRDSADLALATTVALPVVRGPAALAKAAAAIDLLSGGRLVLGVGPGSSALDHALAGTAYPERWARFDEAVAALRRQLGDGWPPPAHDRFYGAIAAADLTPRPTRPGGPPLWVGSWGSPAGLERVARLGDGWLASAMSTTPEQVTAGLEQLQVSVQRYDRPHRHLTCAVATMWTCVTDEEQERLARLDQLAGMLDRSPEHLADRVMVGPPERCAQLLAAYAAAGVELLFVWPLADPEDQLERVMRDVVPLLAG